MVWTKLDNDTFNRLALQQCRMTNGRINLYMYVYMYIKLEKHKLNQIAERNIRISLDKHIAFSKQSYSASQEKGQI